jgi:Fe-S-cluster containining protein
MTMLRDAVLHASTRPEIPAAVARVYADLQREIDARKPVCNASGRCCRFDEFGHRLYVTTIELAAFVAALLPLPGTPGRGQGRGASDVPSKTAVDLESDPYRRPHPDSTRTLPLSLALSPEYRGEGTNGCPFQLAGLCSVHAIRPFGCRVFFCDSTSDDWQHEQYERFHAELKRLHEQFEVPYRYLEWRDALRQLDLMPHPSPEARKSLSLPQLPL